MAPALPPAFEEAANCAICGCGFGTFKRRHHCRACGRTLCNEHSSNQMALPQFGLHAPVRVCKDCFTAGDKSLPVETVATAEPSLDADIDATASGFSSVRLESADVESTSTLATFDCKCGMPLCICSPPDPPKVSTQISQPAASSTRSRKMATSSPVLKQPLAPSKQSPSLFFSSGQTAKAEDHAFSRSYAVSGEGLREAIKNGDANAVKDLLAKGVDANYTDKQGMSLLHLAAVFNLTEIAFILLDNGANAYAKNSQGETPLDCSQTTLHLKIQQKLTQRP